MSWGLSTQTIFCSKYHKGSEVCDIANGHPLPPHTERSTPLVFAVKLTLSLPYLFSLALSEDIALFIHSIVKPQTFCLF